MSKKDNLKKFVDEIYSTPPKKNYPLNKILYNHIDEISSIDLAEFQIKKRQITKDIDIYSS